MAHTWKDSMKFQKPGSRPLLFFSGLKLGGLSLLLSFFLVSPGWAAPAASAPVPREALLQKIQTLIQRSADNETNLQKAAALLEKALRDTPDDPRILVNLAEVYYRMADPAKDIDKTFPTYEKSGQCAQKALKIAPNRSEGHYWYGLFLLKKAQKVGGLRAFFIVRTGIRELNRVRKELPAYDHAGASRVLGLLYCLAPGWSPFGDLRKSIALEKEAIQIAPEYLLNRLYLARAFQKKGDKRAAVQQYRKILAISPAPRNRNVDLRYQEEARRRLTALGQPVKSSPILPD